MNYIQKEKLTSGTITPTSAGERGIKMLYHLTKKSQRGKNIETERGYNNIATKGNDLSTPCLAKKSMKSLASCPTCFNSTLIEEDSTLISLKITEIKDIFNLIFSLLICSPKLLAKKYIVIHSAS